MTVYLGTDLIAGVTTTVDKSERIGQIIQSTIPLVDAGLHLLDGALIQGSGIYDDFVTYISNLDTSADYFCTEAEWQTSVMTYGVCGKFVYDSVNNTVRLPKYSNKIYSSSINSTAPVKGNGMTVGMTDGTNNFGMTYVDRLDGRTSMYGSAVGSTNSGSSPASKTVGITTDGTKSGIIADLANITTSLDGYYYIVVATSTKTDIEVDIDEIATDLNGKADTDLSNVPSSKGILTESYVNGASWYRVYSDGWCEQGGTIPAVSGSGITTVTLLKTYKDTNYTILTTLKGTSGMSDHYGQAEAISSSQFSSRMYSLPGMYYCCGYIR